MRPFVVQLPTRRTASTTMVRLLGDPPVSVGDGCHGVPEGSKRLLAYVALKHGCVERVRLAGVLWPEADDRRAAGNLRSALWRLRGAHIDVLTADKDSLSLRADVDVDVRAVARWADRLIQGRSGPEDGIAPGELAGAVDLLPGWYDDWVIAERERLRQRVLHAVESLGQQLTAAGRHAEAIEAAIMAIDADPLRESAHRVLIEAHLAEGNWVEARSCFAMLRRMTLRELGVEPSPGLWRMIDLGSGGPVSTIR
jgi:DNA-binding SARP family transcriptional activator